MVYVLIADEAQDDMQLTLRMQQLPVLQLGRIAFYAGNVMTCVADYHWLLRGLHPSAHQPCHFANTAEAAGNGLGRCGMALQTCQCMERREDVMCLIIAA